jgi:mannose-6-phosphate isomerase
LIAFNERPVFAFEAARAARDSLRTWAVEEAYPIWGERGVDHRRGGFVEAMSHAAEPLALPRRARVQPRQLYSFAVAGALGWSGDADAILRSGLDWFERHYRRPDGLVRTLVDVDGRALDDSVVLYDQAFALFAMAACAPRVLEPDLTARAARHRDRLITRQKHAVAGFDEAPDRPQPLLSNPHMHLFEASLAWVDIGGDPVWRALADEIANLAMTHFIDPVSGGLREYFAADWSPAPGVAGRIVEPGHQYEWAWLLLRWASLASRRDAADAALRMIAFAEAHGIDRDRGVAINALLDDASVHDAKARLWPQTERIKAATAAALQTGDPLYWAMAADAAEGLMRYFGDTQPGLWRDVMEPDGSFSDTVAPASSFYHIVCAILELHRAVETVSMQSRTTPAR